jgi:hypothetical protein
MSNAPDKPDGKRIKHICGAPYPFWIAVLVWGIVGGLILGFMANSVRPLYLLIAAGIIGALMGVTFGVCLRRWPPPPNSRLWKWPRRRQHRGPDSTGQEFSS